MGVFMMNFRKTLWVVFVVAAGFNLSSCATTSSADRSVASTCIPTSTQPCDSDLEKKHIEDSFVYQNRASGL